MAMKTTELTIVDARRELMSLPEKLEDGPTAVRVTRRGKPVLAIMSWEDYEALMETIEVMSDPAAMEQLRKGIQDMKEGRTIPWEDAKKQLGWH